MTRYTNNELNGDWEFKTLRSPNNKFRRREVLEQAVEEEALAGWQLLEKLDDGRLRFKRPASARKRDAMLPPEIDPYRTRFGGLSNRIRVKVTVAMAALLGGVVFFIFFGPGGGEGSLGISATEGLIVGVWGVMLLLFLFLVISRLSR